MKKNIIIALLIILAVFICFRQENKDYYDYLIVSGATPLAIAQRVPADISLTIDGLVKKKYQFSGDALNALATTRIRTREISPDGEFLGAYIHLGIPVFNILEGISPQKPDHYLFHQPLDILVTFHSDSGQQACFSFNEIIMTDDRLPATLAFSRKPLLPTNETVQKAYAANRYEADIEGLRLICPKDPDTARYLDNVTRISYSVIAVDEEMLPARKKNFKCVSDAITCSDGKQAAPGIFGSVARASNNHWLRCGGYPISCEFATTGCRADHVGHPGQRTIIAGGFSETGRVRAAQKLSVGQYVKKPYTMENIGIAVRDELAGPHG